MRHLVRRLGAGVASSQQIPLSLPFPYEYTLAPQDFTLHDIRFKELPFSREFAPPQREHLQTTLKSFQRLLNLGVIPDAYVQKSLIRRAFEVRRILGQSEVDLLFRLKPESLVKSQGYLEVKPGEGVSLKEQDLQQIHRYKLQRERETLTVSLKQQRERLTAEQQLKKDLAEKMGGAGKEVRQKLQQMRFSKEALFMDRFLGKLMSIGKSAPRQKFEPYFIVDQIEGEMQVTMRHRGVQFRRDAVRFDSKWCYWAQNLESADLKRHRKRTLFDFQFWNRGSFFPIRNYAAELADLE